MVRDRQTDRRTDRPTDIATYRAAIAAKKTKVAYLNEKTSETFQDSTLILNMPILGKFKPISVSP